MKLSKITWILVEISVIFLYVVAIGYGYMFEIPWLGWLIFAALIVLHLFEMKTALKVGREKGLSNRRIIIKNLIFGFTWWIPLKRGIFNK